MNFTIDKKAFLAEIAKVTPAVASRSSLPVLSGIRLIANGSRISLAATDLEFEIRLQAPAKTPDGFGDAVVPANSLTKAVKTMPGPEVTVEFQEKDERCQVTISSGKKSVTLDCYPARDWPDIAKGVEWEPVCWFDAAGLADALSGAVLCASTDEARPVLTGVQFNLSGEGLELVATDSYRLGIASAEAELKGELPDTAPIVPARVLKALVKQLKKDDGRGLIYFGTLTENGNREIRFVEFSFGTAVSWVVRQIEGEFPNWRQLVPEESGGLLEFDSKELTQAAEGAADLRSQKSVPVRIRLDDPCVLEMKDSQVGSVTEDLEKASYSPNGVGPMTIAFNPEFLVDGINFIGEERGRMRATDAVKPALFLSSDGRRYVLMPVRMPS
jgi:DNA polymerase-3 subunit beta